MARELLSMVFKSIWVIMIARDFQPVLGSWNISTRLLHIEIRPRLLISVSTDPNVFAGLYAVNYDDADAMRK